MIDFVSWIVHNLAHKTFIHLASQNGNTNGGQLNRVLR